MTHSDESVSGDTVAEPLPIAVDERGYLVCPACRSRSVWERPWSVWWTLIHCANCNRTWGPSA